MWRLLAFFVTLALLGSTSANAGPVPYALTITTAFSAGDPFPNEIDQSFVEQITGYFQVQNTGASTFSGTIGTIAVSSFAGDLSFTSGLVTLAPGAAVSVGIPDNSDDVGGFNGPFFEYRPGVEITLNGTVSQGPLSENISQLVADANIHSGVPRTDIHGLTSDSFVLQGGDPWGFQNDDPFALSQADGVFTVPEPGSVAILATALTLVVFARRRWVFRTLAG